MNASDEIRQMADALGFDPAADWLRDASDQVQGRLTDAERPVAVSEAHVAGNEAFAILTSERLHLWNPKGQRALGWDEVRLPATIGGADGVELLADGAPVVLLDAPRSLVERLAHAAPQGSTVAVTEGGAATGPVTEIDLTESAAEVTIDLTDNGDPAQGSTVDPAQADGPAGAGDGTGLESASAATAVLAPPIPDDEIVADAAETTGAPEAIPAPLPTEVTTEAETVAAPEPMADQATDSETTVAQRNVVVRVIWFLLVGWWASAILVLAAWVISLPIAPVGVAARMMSRLGQVTTLARPGVGECTFEPAGLASFNRSNQYPAAVRVLYLLAAGWLFALIAALAAWVLSVTWFGARAAHGIVDVYPTIVTLQRD